MQKKILITGGAGYLGGRISQYLAHHGYQIRLGVRGKDLDVADVSTQFERVEIDFKDDTVLTKACSGVDFIIHLAAMNAEACGKKPEEALLVNSLGTLKLLKAAKKNKVTKFLYFSTAHVYGSPLMGEINEESLPRPLHSYSITHRMSEDYVIEEAYKAGISTSVFRLTNAVGSPITSRVNCWMLVVNDLCRQVVVSNSIKVYSNKFLQRDFVSISSVCPIVKSFLDSNVLDGQIVNLSSGVSVTLQYLAVLIADRSKVVLGFRPRVSFLKKSIDVDIEKLTISNKKLIDLGFKIDGNLSDEIDQLLLNCKKWFST
jgi:UDP-glucose 4-epimerase